MKHYKLLICIGLMCTVIWLFWPASPAPIMQLDLQTDIGGMYSNHQGSMLALSSRGRPIELWAFEQQKLARLPQTLLPRGAVSRIEFDPTDMFLAVGYNLSFARQSTHKYTIVNPVDRSQLVQVWDIATETVVQQLTCPQLKAVYALTFSPDGDYLAAGGADGHICIWEIETSALRYEYQGHPWAGEHASITSLTFSSQGDLLASGAGNGTVEVWKLAASRVILSLAIPKRSREYGESSSIRDVAFLQNDTQLIAGSRNSNLRVWAVADGRVVAEFGSPRTPVMNMAVSADERYVVIGSGNVDEEFPFGFLGNDDQPRIQVWRIDPPKLLCTLEHHDAPIRDVLIHPTDGVLLSISADGILNLWKFPCGT